jgi:PAS domain S-box-containing protein
MDFLKQNKKLILSSFSILIVSMCILLLFASTGNEISSSGHASVAGKHGSGTSNSEESFYGDYLEEDENVWFVTDVSGNYADVSDEYCNLIGRKAEEIKGTLLFSDINAKDLPAIMSENSKLLLNANKVEGLGPYRIMKTDSEEILVIFKAVPILNKENNKVSKIVFSVKDISQIVEETKIR